jgi:hypothetical protein
MKVFRWYDLERSVCVSVGSSNNKKVLDYLIGIQLPEKYKENFGRSSCICRSLYPYQSKAFSFLSLVGYSIDYKLYIARYLRQKSLKN